MLGADPEELERLAGLIDRTVGRIGQSQRIIGRQLTTAGWRGADADHLRLEWRTQGAGAVGGMQALLRECAAMLRAQSAAQREASAARSDPAAEALAKVARRSETTTYTAEGVVPGRILNVKAGVTVSGTISEDQRGVVLTVTQSFSPGVTAGLAKAGKGTGKSSGRSPIKASGEAGVTADGERTRSYRFDTWKAAEEAWEEYLKETVPTRREAVNEFLRRGGSGVGARAVGVAVDGYEDGERYLESIEDRIESHTVKYSGSTGVDSNLGTNLLDLNGGWQLGTGVVVDKMTNQTTVFVKAAADAGAALGLASGIESDVEAGVTVDAGGNPQALKLSGSIGLQGGLNEVFGLDPSSAEARAGSLPAEQRPRTSAEAGLATTFSAEVDLTNQDNREYAMAYLRAAGSGHHVEAAQHLRALLDRAAVTVTTADSVATGTSVDAVVASASEETSRSTTRDVFIRVPGGSWQYHRL